MNIYVIKSIYDVTQVQLNVSRSRDIKNTRRSIDGNKVVLKLSVDVAEKYFPSDRWYSLEEMREVLSGSEWTAPAEPEELGFIDKVVSFLGF